MFPMSKEYLMDNEAVTVIGENVRKYRKLKKLSQQTLAHIVGVEYSQINRVELGKINTSISLIWQIAKALEVEPYLLLKRD